MKRTVILAVAAAMGVMAQAVVKRGYESRPVSSASGVAVDFRVDSIDYRKDLTRVYGRLVGLPNTSGRIDRVKMGSLECTDIDGVDFNRYYQWEEDGVIPVELDFPAQKPAGVSIDFLFATPRGEASVKAVKKGR